MVSRYGHRGQIQFLFVHLHVEIEEILNQDSSLSAGLSFKPASSQMQALTAEPLAVMCLTVVRFDVPTALLMKIQIFVDVTCSLVNIYRRFGTAYYIQNVSNYSPIYASCFRRLKSSFSSSKIYRNLSYLFSFVLLSSLYSYLSVT
jgi:hypothetical protein